MMDIPIVFFLMILFTLLGIDDKIFITWRLWNLFDVKWKIIVLYIHISEFSLG